ncbi:MAG: (6-4) photolyase [Alphaproteobacteria bacterium MarineAlpha11_Bin1]|nr:MAG: (6-4) photolyase [Alphaproteobacteria bacterium MarineAlpha11_Bin1]
MTVFKPDRVVLILGDQLSLKISSLRSANKYKDQILLAEVDREANYVLHHKKKIAFMFSAMRHFAAELSERGWNVRYVKLDASGNTGTLSGELGRALNQLGIASAVYTEASEYRITEEISNWANSNKIVLEVLTDDRFVCSHRDFEEWAAGRKQMRMEFFYRLMRRKTGLLMDGDKPEGGKWNFDKENRKPASENLSMQRPLSVAPDKITDEVLTLVEKRFPNNFGELRPFWFAVTRNEALKALDSFIRHALPSFGDFQDAMLDGEPFLFHSALSQYINAGLLDPLEVCRRVEAAWYSGTAPLNAVEGYIRQIIGWREYVRGIYWLKMPKYTDHNFFGAKRPLPSFYWTGKTDMACIRAAINQTRDEAYAHHIQRLMVTGNFAMLAGVDPKELHKWYLAVYADAYEWVEAPNVIGMSQFADGGLVASKPYAASGNYINKMSNHCRSCRFQVNQKTGADACPFNSLYWDFLVRNRDKLSSNPRLGNAYRTWAKMSEKKRKAYRETAQETLEKILI